MVKAGNIAGFEVTYGDSGLFVMATIKQITLSGLVADSTVIMSPSNPGTYYGFHVPPSDAEISYLVTINAYTDGTYSTVNANYATSSRSYSSVILASSEPVINFINGPVTAAISQNVEVEAVVSQNVAVSATITQDEEIG